MLPSKVLLRRTSLFIALALTSCALFAQVQAPAAATPPAVGNSTAPTDGQSRRAARAARRRQRSQQQAVPQAQPTPGAAAAQRQRDQQILAAQQAQSAETARENAAVTSKVVRDQQAQQAEPRIQDAPGPGSQPLPGDPAVQPAQTPDPRAIQDAPGPAQTLPKPPPQH